MPISVGHANEVSEIRPPRILQALRHRGFKWFWASNFLSNVGTWMQNVAQGWLVLQLTNSPFWLGVVGFASTIPALFLSLVGGVIADHFNRRTTMIVTESTMMASAFLMSALTFWKVITVKEIIFLTSLTGIAMAINAPTYQALVPGLVPRKDLTNAVALNSAQFNLSRILGSTLGGFAMAGVGVAANFFLNGLSFLAPIIALTHVRYPEALAPGEGDFWLKLKQGFSCVFHDPEMSSLFLLIGIGSLFAMPYLVFVPYFARDVLHSGERGLGLLMACSGCGAFLGAGTVAYLNMIKARGRFLFSAGLAFFVSILFFAFSRSLILSCALLMTAGYSVVLMGATANAVLQHLVEDRMRGRIMSIYSTAFMGLPPIGSLIAGSLTRVFTAPHVIAGMAAVGFVGTVAVFAGSKALRRLD